MNLEYILKNPDLAYILVDDLNKEYTCYKNVVSKQCSYLHKLILNIDKHPIINEYLRDYLKTERGQKEINLQNSKKLSPLMLACYNTNNIEIVKLLLEHGADINLCDINNETVFMHSIYNNTLELTKLLLEYKADINYQNKDLNTALICATKNNNLEIMELLLENKANVDLQNEYGRTALTIGCNAQNVCLATIELLLKYNANVNLQTKENNIALILACDNNCSLEIIKLLIDYGSNINHRNKRNNTALMVECRKELYHFEKIKFLINNGADIFLNSDDPYKDGTLYSLLKKLNIDHFEYFLEYYKKINRDILENYISNIQIPLNIYEALVSNKIINVIKKDWYKNSKYNIDIIIPLRLVLNYKIQESECIVCSEITNTLCCNYNHNTCLMCLNKTKNVCQGCLLPL